MDLLVPGARFELALHQLELRPERSVYTNFTIRADVDFGFENTIYVFFCINSI